VSDKERPLLIIRDSLEERDPPDWYPVSCAGARARSIAGVDRFDEIDSGEQEAKRIKGRNGEIPRQWWILA
jgi:hypothetical protein